MLRSVAVLILAVAAASAASLTGTWKMDASRSKLDPPSTIVFEPAPRGYKYTSAVVKATHWPVDNTPVPSPTEPDVMVTRRRVSDHVIEERRALLGKAQGKVISTVLRTISPDGKRLTVHGQGKNSDDTPFDYTTSYDRVTPVVAKDLFAGTWQEDFFAQVKEAIVLTLSETSTRFEVRAKGYTWSAPFDGMTAPVKLSWADQGHVERQGPGKVKAQLTKKGRITREETYSVSADGATLTIQRKIPGASPARGFLEIYRREASSR